jgi:hypothetical protein
VRRFMHAAPADRPSLTMERRPRSDNGDSYIATVEGVDVFGADFTPGVAWLFSAKALRSVRYGELHEPAQYVSVTYELGEQMKGILRVRVRQHLDWADTPIFEIEISDAADR